MKRSTEWWKNFARKYRDARQELVDNRAHRAYVYRNYLLKAPTIKSAYDRLDNECQNLLISEEDKTELEGILLRLRAMRNVISKPNSITDILDKFEIKYTQNINVCGVELHYLGYLFIRKPKFTWEMCLFTITFSNKPLRQYALKQMLINQIRFTHTNRLRVFLSQIGRGDYISSGTGKLSDVEGLEQFYHSYEAEHLKQVAAPPLETDYQPVHHPPNMKEPEGYLVDEETLTLVEKLTS